MSDEKNEAGESLYEWFDRRTKSRGHEVCLHTSCSVVVHHLGMLYGLGIQSPDIRNFVERVLHDCERMMLRVSPDKTPAQNLEAILASGPDLRVVPGGKEPS